MDQELEELEEDEAKNIVDQYQDIKETWHYESYSGVRSLEELVADLGYENMTEFLADNPGACEAIVGFIREWAERNSDWKNNLAAIIAKGKQPRRIR